MGSEDFAAWREMSIERILRGLDAALIILHIGTSPKISQCVHQDEAYDRVVAISRFHLETNVYPEFDPIYKAGMYICIHINTYIQVFVLYTYV